MKTLLKLTLIFCVGLLMFSCEKKIDPKDIPNITPGKNDIGTTTANIRFAVTNWDNITSAGLDYGTDVNNLESETAIVRRDTIVYVLSELTPNTTYHYKAYISGKWGEKVTEFKTFTTSVDKATITTTEISEITATSAVGGGDVTSAGNGSISERGVCWNTTGEPTVSDSKTSSGSGTGTFTSNITGLSESTTYYVKAYATNSAGTSYGEQSTKTHHSTEYLKNPII